MKTTTAMTAIDATVSRPRTKATAESAITARTVRMMVIWSDFVIVSVSRTASPYRPKVKDGLRSPRDRRNLRIGRSRLLSRARAVPEPELMKTALATGLASLLLAGAANAQSARPTLDRFFPVGEDFCFGRAYDAAHLGRNPKQSVTAIHVGGRNAQRSAPSPGNREATTAGNVYVTLTVRFRDTPSPRTWPGSCFEEGSDAIRCKIYPPRNQDTIVQGLTMRQDGAGATIEAMGDWKTFRRAADRDDNDLGRANAARDDRLFRVTRLPAAACSLSNAYWSAKGATAKLLGALP